MTDSDKDREADLFVEMADRIAHRHTDYLPALRLGPIKLSPEARERWEAFLASIPAGSSFYCDTDRADPPPQPLPPRQVELVLAFAWDTPVAFIGAPEWKRDAAGPARRMKSAIHEERGSWFQLECGHRFHVTVEESLEPSRCWPSFSDVVPCPRCT